MKRLFIYTLAGLLLFAAAAPAKASGQEEMSNQEACQSIPPPSTNGVGSLQRLQALQRCEIETHSKEQQMSSTSMPGQSNHGASMS